MAMLFRGKVYRGAPGGCSIPDRDFPLLVRWFKEGKMPLDLMVTAATSWSRSTKPATRSPGKIAGRAIVEF